ncbi:HlyD family secretion protein [Lysobacter capsici AZ78]|uniref:HlyD family secretion protein n=1 Tax=Lysobacter capsici AZ78 TaxID=1444315 RepID=A0A108UC00_9GAMM|nr:HlyD family efflux transporter periplasmic adaptor subunit [Lysobacter capsici]KWS06240.1 HlyD family secretion protein [Lysobacter capsici AZ78]
MHEDLFRREMLDARKQRWLGSIRLPVSRMGWPMAGLALAALIALLALLGFGRYTRSESASGQLIPRGGLLNVSAPAGGRIARSHVVEGQTVARGQTLLEISAELDSPALGAGVGQAVGAELALQRQRLLAERDAIERERDTDSLRQRIDDSQRRIDLADAQLRLRREQAAQAERLSRQVQPLRAAKLLSDVQWQQYETTRIDSLSRVQDAQRERLDAARELADARAALADLPRHLSERRGRIERELADIAQDDAHNEGRRRIAVLAPRAGRISGWALTEGQAIGAGQRLFSLLPEHAPLQAELWLPDRAIGLIAAGTPVTLRYPAFPYQTYGLQRGRVAQIARAPLSAQDIRERTGRPADAPAWRVLVDLDRQQVASHALQAQMRVDAELQLERRRLYEFLVLPGVLAPNASAPTTTQGDAP